MKLKLIAFAVCVSCGLGIQAVDFLPAPGSQKGSVVIVNKQSRLPEAELQEVCQQIEKATKCKAEVASGEGAQVIIEVIDDAESPILTAWPEDYKAKVNVAKLDKNLKGKALEKFYASRCRKEILRAFCYACGAGGSQYPDNIMAIKDITGLDLVEEFIPGDTSTACVARLVNIGVTPTKFVSYARAVRDGWAPAPTNEVQQSVWDKIKAQQAQKPTKPLKITPDMKPQGK